MAILATESLSLRFGGLDALSGVTLEIPDLSLFAVIGPNGAGKTSFFNCLTGFYRPSSGSVRFDGTDITRLAAHRVAALGIRRTFQNVRVFPRLSARENVLIGAHLRASASPWGTVFGSPGMRRRELELADEAEHWLNYVGLGDKADVLAADLAYGVRKRLEVARALIARPRVLLLDEPAAGVSSVERDELADVIHRTWESGVTVVIIEHDVELVMQLAKTVAVLDRGRLLVEGQPEAVRNDQRVIDAYLGAQTPVSVLDVSNMTVYYGPVRGVSEVSLRVDKGEIVALLGANGAGKSTVLKALSGLVKPLAGSLSFLGQDLGRVAPAARVRLGLVHVPEGRRIFPSLTVSENLELAGFGFGGHRSRRRERLQAVLERFPILAPHMPKLAGMLSGGEQQILAIARGMMAEPTLLMVDEPSLGLGPQMVESVYDLLVQIATEGTAVLLVEQNVTLAFEITHRAYVLQQGRVVLSGLSSELADDPRVVAAYLGARAEPPGRAPQT